MSDIRLAGVKKSYGANLVIPDLDLEVPSGSFTAFVGPSGCGKSTLLRILAGLEEIDEGSIHIEGQDVTAMRPADRGLAMVFQSYALYPHMSVRDNIAFALKLAKTPKEEIDKRILKAAEMLQLSDMLERKPRELSGGQRQRVAIGRAIVREPKAFLFDEPLSNLDAALRGKMRVELIELHRNLGATIVYVTHDQVEAMTMADRIVVLNAGKIEQVGASLDLYANPASLFVAKFIGSPPMNLFEGPVANKFGAHTLGVRPEHLDISSESGDWKGVVRVVEQLGSDTNIQAMTDEIGMITTRAPGNSTFNYGDTVYLSPRPAHLHRFDQDGKPISS